MLLGKIVSSGTLSYLSNWIRYSILVLLLILQSVGLPMASVQVGALTEAMEILERLLWFLVQVTVQLVQNNLKLHHRTAAVGSLNTILFAQVQQFTYK